MNIIQKAKDHLYQNKMTYCEHLIFAVSHGINCLKAGIMLVVHGLLPCFFDRSGSNLVRHLKLSFDRNEHERATKNKTN